jgi:hypothetical protein
MRRIVIMLSTTLLSLAALTATPELAAARDGCGAGRYWNGYRCAPIGYYGPRVYRDYRDYNRSYAQPYGRPLMNGPCPYGQSLQDGVCKQYRGY